jgi:hypothetical protein
VYLNDDAPALSPAAIAIMILKLFVLPDAASKENYQRFLHDAQMNKIIATAIIGTAVFKDRS